MFRSNDHLQNNGKIIKVPMLYSCRENIFFNNNSLKAAVKVIEKQKQK